MKLQWVCKMCRFVQKKNEGGEIENCIKIGKETMFSANRIVS
jgi:rubredoxin